MEKNELLLFFDLETTGCFGTSVFSKWNKVLQIACKSKDKSFDAFVNPEILIPPWSSKIHGIYDKDVKNAETFKQVLLKMIDLFEFEQYEKVILISYNGKYFDELILRTQTLPSNILFYDPLPEIRKMLQLPSYRLADVYTHLTKQEPLLCHRADSDVIMLETIFNTLKLVYKKPTDPVELDSIKYIGQYRKTLIQRTLRIRTVREWKRKIPTIDDMDKFLDETVNITENTHRYYILVELFGYDQLREYIENIECLNDVDYYFKVKNEDLKMYNSVRYQRGLMILSCGRD